MFIDLNILNRELGELTIQEQELLRQWLSESKAHEALYEKIKNRNPYILHEDQFIQWREEYINKLNQRRKKRRITNNYRITIGIAASVLIVLGIYSAFFNTRKSGFDTYISSNNDDIIITTSSGEKWEWEQIKSDTLFMDGVPIVKQNNALTYHSAEREDEIKEIAMNDVYVPRGKEFQLELSDHTKIWLNSDTKIQFPVTFPEKERRLTMTGEAYFQVAKDANKPFIVVLEDVEIKVLGTQFNVNTRRKGKQSMALIEGSISIKQKGEQEKILLPGETAEIDLQTKKMTVSASDTRIFTAWLKKAYLFENESIENILNELALWYDVEITYENEAVKNEKFSGWLQRNHSIEPLLRSIEKTTYLQFILQQNKINVKQTNNNYEHEQQ